MEGVRKFLLQEQQKFFQRDGIATITVSDSTEGVTLVENMLQKIVDKRTVIYLSGGKTPKMLYSRLSESGLQAGAVGMIDERYGKKFHDKSNELMMKETGLLRTMELQGVQFYPILQFDTSREETADDYDQKVRELLAQYTKNVGILGIGTDGHTSSIIPNRPDFHNPLFDAEHKNLFVSQFNDEKSAYHERIGMTFLGLSMLDVIIILIFGIGIL